MKTFDKLEERIISKKNPQKSKHLVLLATVLLLAGVTMIFGGTSYLRGKSVIFADIASPPSPPEPDIQNPPSPSNPNGEFLFAPGWSLVAGQDLAGRDLSELKNKDLVLYSFNDPAYPTRVWSSYPDSDGNPTSIVPHAPYAYYVYNAGSTTVDVTLLASSETVSDQEMIARGWHLMYWPGTAATLSDMLLEITLKYSDGTEMSALQATNEENHRASIDVNVIVNTGASDVKTAVKTLASSDSDTTISKIPANSFFWLYLRRTKDRVVKMNITGQDVTTTATVTATATATSTD